jgi:dTMP kinase
VTGLFVSFEGIEGCGKSTQVGALEEWIRSRGRTVVTVREPGGTPLSEKIREILLRGDAPPGSPWAELCLYLAARAELTMRVIRPAIEHGAVVIADRFAEASVAYQGAGRSLGLSRVRSMNRAVTGGLRPDRIFLLDLDPEEGLRRIRAGRGADLDRLESEPLPFHRRVRAAYLRMAGAEPQRFVVLDAAASPEDLGRRIRRELVPLLSRKRR